MQGKLLAAALIAIFPLAASAQSSVTVYGVADAAIAAEDTGAPDGSRTVLNSGNQSSSRLGFRGTEDLGGGLKAMFNLEAGVALDSGAADSALFGRRAVVGLEGAFGQLTLGREYSPIADIANATDINGQGFYGSNLSAFVSGRLTRRLSNSVNYKSPSLGGFKFNAAHSAGETQTGASQDLTGVSATYVLGNLFAGIGYHVAERAVSGDDKEMIVGLGYKMGAVELKANYLTANPTGNNNKFEQLNVGASYAFGASKVLANVQRNELENGAKGNGFNVAYTYSLSKRTNVYANYARLSNNATGVFGLVAASTNVTPPSTARGADPSALSLGVRHSF
ncbi:porin [Massilia sp. PAMC28688]|uniref:porin n=1 Tax=Massilia sp. PAMC28688 TaxID=2861283 RepID=UPI001C625536|nr:porin [Massilia sp. PAMC28688]QYF93951.1 porin [Massilia sp. PAMC28688]